MPTLSNGSGALRINVPRGSSLIIRNQSGDETVTGSSVAREDATAALGANAFVYGPQTASSDVSISTTGVLTYDIVAGDPTPASTPAVVSRSASTGAPSGLIDPATGQPVGGGGDPTLRRQLAAKVQKMARQRFWNERGGCELFQLPRVWSAKYFAQGEACLSTNGQIIWLCSKSGTSTVEPVRDADYPRMDVRDAAGAGSGAIWQPFDVSMFEITKRESLRAANGAIAVPTVSERWHAGSPTPQDASATNMTRRYYFANANETSGAYGGNTAQYAAYRAANNIKFDTPDSWFVNGSNSAGYYAEVKAAAGVISGNEANNALISRFYTKAKSIGITLPFRDGAGTSENTVAKGNIIIDMVAADFGSARGATITNLGGRALYYQWNFADEVEREVIVYGQGGFPVEVWTSSNQDIYPQPTEIIRAITHSDSTGAGAGPGPSGQLPHRWPNYACAYMGVWGVTQFARGGLGYIDQPVSPKLFDTGSDIKSINFLEKLKRNQQWLDTRMGAPKIDFFLLDQVGWDVDIAQTRYDIGKPAWVFSGGGGAETWSIDGATRRAGFREVVSLILAYQPDTIIVSVGIRNHCQPVSVNARGKWSGFESEAQFQPAHDAVAADWLLVLEELVPPGQLCMVNLNGWRDQSSRANIQEALSPPQNDKVHRTTWYHMQQGLYVGQQFLRWLGGS